MAGVSECGPNASGHVVQTREVTKMSVVQVVKMRTSTGTSEAIVALQSARGGGRGLGADCSCRIEAISV